MSEGVCKTDPDLEPDDFILPRGRSSRKGKEACGRCDYVDECYDYGVRSNSVGIWGGEVLDIRADHPEEPRELQVLVRLDDRRPKRADLETDRSHKSDPNTYPSTMAARTHLG